MKGYVRTLEAIIASSALILALVLSINLLSSRRDLGLIKKSDIHSVKNYVYGVIEYLAITGELSNLVHNNCWNELRSRLDELLTARGIGYRLVVYSISDEGGGNIEQRSIIVSSFDPSNKDTTSIYYYIPPSPRVSNGYLLEITISW